MATPHVDQTVRAARPARREDAGTSAASYVNFSAIAGMVGGVALLVAAIAATASDPLSFLDLPSAVLVFGGTLAATLITYSVTDVGRAFARFAGLLTRENIVDQHDTERFVRIAKLWKGGKIKDVEEDAEVVRSPFVKTGLRLLLDGMPGDAIVTVLEWRMKRQEALERKEAAVFRTMAAYAPAFGMAGTLIGIVNMLRLMGQGATPSQIGTNLAFALITTLYGLVLANAFLRPIAAKIEAKTHEHLFVLAAVAEAFREISEGHGPSHVREVLTSIAEHHTSEMNAADTVIAPAEETRHAATPPGH